MLWSRAQFTEAAGQGSKVRRLRSLRGVGTRLAEAAAAIILVAICFSLVLELLDRVFPSGASLGELLAARQSSGSYAGTGSETRSLYADGLDAALQVGVLSERHNDVRSKSVSSVAWGDANTGMSLFDRDAVQTLKNSTAEVAFSDRNKIELGPNTLVVLSQTQQDLFSDQRRSSLLVMDGEIRGRLTGSGADRMELEVTTQDGTVARLRSAETSTEDVEFRIKLNEDKTTTVTVERGVAEVTTGGETVSVEAQQYTRFGTNLIHRPRGLMAAPRLISPQRMAEFRFRELPPEIEVSWSSIVGIDQYRIVIATDPRFRDIVTEMVVSSPHCTFLAPGQGTYYWRTGGVSGGLEVTSRLEGSFRLVQDQRGPKLEVDFPEQNVPSPSVVLRGRTDPGTTVFVEGTAVLVDSEGRFEHDTELDRGMNVIVVEAIDAVGNVTYQSQMINRKR